MPGIIQSGRKRTSVVLSEDDEQSDPPTPVSTGSKRARRDRDASEFSSSADHSNIYHNPVPTQNGHQDADEYTEEAHQPGSIVRVRLTNFVTYTAAEFHPGPSLNMVIGPNGTGKSTLVCAICLGLGWGPKHLGRSKELGEYVKHGSAEAEIEIELAAGKSQSKNPVVRRLIRKEGNKSVFFIDGQQSAQQSVVKLARSFSIQIDNLCQFLPQDRVTEFAALEPVALLRETQRAAAPEQMVLWHDKLKILRAEEKRLEVEQANEDGHMKDLQKKQNVTREDVDRWNQRQELVVTARALEKCRPMIEMKLLKNQLENVKAERKTRKRALEQLTAEVAPSRQAQAELEGYRDQIEQATKSRRSHVDMAKVHADKLVADIKSGQDHVHSCATKKAAELDAEKKRRQEVKRIEGDIARLERARQECPVVYAREEGEAKIKELRSKLSSNERREMEVTGEQQTTRQRVQELKAFGQEKTNQRATLDTQSGQQANKLQRMSPDTARGWKWIQDNRASLSFKGEVCGPPILECSVTEPRFAYAVENMLGINDLTAITCENGDDARVISNQLLGVMGLHQVSIRTQPKPSTFYRSPVTQEQLRGYGFDGWILDYIKGPDPVLAMLCDNKQLHRAAFTTKQISNEQHAALENSPISVWIADQDKCQITRRKEYGISSTRVVTVRPTQYFTDQPVDAEEKRRLDDAIREIKREMQDVIEQHQAIREEARRLEAEQKETKAEIEVIRDDLEQRRKAVQEWQGLPAKITEKQIELKSVEDIRADTSGRIRDIIAESEQAALKVASLTIEYAKAVTSLRQVHEALVEADIRLVEANSEVDALRDENRDIQARLDAMKAEVKRLDVLKKAIVADHNRMARNTQEDWNNLSEAEAEIVQKYQNLPTLDDLANEIESVNARLELMAEGNPGAIKAYEKRAQEIEKVQEKLEHIGADLETTKQQITQIRGQWEPELDGLVAKISDEFSYNMQQIGCAGMVCVYKDEDFERWSIQIYVGFREGEPLALLTNQRQSGGERSVSTFFYLMALQGLARAPFRVVDEINQGMDPRNERKVHERVVDIACGERSSQYFLITPKLLNDLKFHPKMKIHCIASGEHMPAQYDKLDFKQLAQLAIRVKMSQRAA